MQGESARQNFVAGNLFVNASMKLSRLFHTVKYLKPAQLAFFVRRRFFPATKVSNCNDAALREGFSLKPVLPVHQPGAEAYEFRFLGVSKSFRPGRIDWAPIDASRLWAYNLHYFDYLRDPDRDLEVKLDLIENWIAMNAQGSQPGWEPFTTSLRVVNWITFALHYQQLSEKQLAVLFTQVRWLFANDERHILANHYFENLKALLFAGCFFDGKEADKWRRHAGEELANQLSEQFLSDGGHYERSPQYHCLMLENVLDLVNLARGNRHLIEDNLTTLLESTARAALEFIMELAPRNQDLPLFNDTALGVAPGSEELAAYARELFGQEVSTRVKTPVMINRPDFGLFGIRTAKDSIIFDSGEVGPEYQPGHTHCDMLSFELSMRGHPVIVDTGVCEYEPGPRRKHLRSTEAHNTISVDGLDQSEVWGEFRVARRAKADTGFVVLSGSLTEEAELELGGSYSGFFPSAFRAVPAYAHSRQINVKLVKGRFESLDVVDSIDILSTSLQKQNNLVESFLHFHPGVQVEILSDRSVALVLPDGTWLELWQRGTAKLELVESIYCPRFGEVQENKCLVMREEVTLPHSTGFSIVEKGKT